MITKPTLLIDESKAKENIKKMFSIANKHNVDFRPHFKTHQSIEISKWFKALGVNKITVSSVSMAKYFAQEWKDITIAFPVNILEIDDINELAKEVNLNIIVESSESILFLSQRIEQKINVFIKIDSGYHRTGIAAENTKLIDQILDTIDSSKLLFFAGFLSHSGHTYHSNSIKDIIQIHNDSLLNNSYLKDYYSNKYPQLTYSIGDTPSCSIVDDFTGVNEIRPGNFVFYDLSQNKLGSCNISQIAVALACPIVAIHKNRSEIIIYGGGVHFSKEGMNSDEGVIFGRVVEQGSTINKPWGNIIPNMYVKSLSQEHGIVSVPKTEISNYKIGDILLILPIHSCMTANLMKSYKTLDGKEIAKHY